MLKLESTNRNRVLGEDLESPVLYFSEINTISNDSTFRVENNKQAGSWSMPFPSYALHRDTRVEGPKKMSSDYDCCDVQASGIQQNNAVSMAFDEEESIGDKFECVDIAYINNQSAYDNALASLSNSMTSETQIDEDYLYS